MSEVSKVSTSVINNYEVTYWQKNPHGFEGAIIAN